MYALITNNSFTRWVNLRKDFPNTSFPNNPTARDLPEGVVFVFDDGLPENLAKTQIAIRSDVPKLTNGKWSISYTVRDMTPQELANATEAEEQAIRSKRNAMLAASDWTQLPDAATDKAAWAAYRHALRNVTRQTGFPFAIEWPKAPTSTEQTTDQGGV